MNTTLRLGLAAVLALLSAGISVKAETKQILTDTSWRAIAPLGNLQGSPINSVGLAWEASHVGWNTSLSFEDSDTAGWRNAVVSPFAGQGGVPTYAIWGAGADATPVYFRKTFELSGPATSALLHMEVDDDAQVYINGQLVIDDQSGAAYNNPFNVDVRGALVPGDNLIAIKAHDSFGLDEALAVNLNIQYVPEPSSAALLCCALASGLFWVRRCRSQTASAR